MSGFGFGFGFGFAQQGTNVNPLTDFAIDINSVGAQRALLPLDIPTYVGDADKGVVHPDIWDFGHTWNGYRYWMVMTPLPTVEPDANENPSIVVSNDLLTWVVPAGLTNPVYPKGTTSYQSDPEILFDDGKLYIIWRGRDALNNIVMYYGYSTDGINWSARVLITFAAGINTNLEVVSPSIIKEDIGFSMFTVDQTGAVNEFVVKKYTSPSIGGTWSLVGVVSFDYSLTGLPDPTTMGASAWYHWHINVTKVNGIYYMITYTRAVTTLYTKIWLATSLDGNSFKMAKYSLMSCYNPTNTVWDAGSYRCAILPFKEDNQFKFHLLYGGRYNDAYGGYPVKIGYTKIELPTTHVLINDSINTISEARAAELILANAHQNGYTFADDFNRVLETVNGLGTASDGTVYAGESVNYWRVSGDYAYLNSNTNSYFRVELTKNYDMHLTMLSAAKVIQCKYIDDNNRISIAAATTNVIIQLAKGGVFTTKSSVVPRRKVTDINDYRIVFNGPLLILYANGIEEMRYTFLLSDFDNQAQMDTFLNETTFRLRLNLTGERIYDITSKQI